jgi:excinuclease UvrABC ATPase subunit
LNKYTEEKMHTLLHGSKGTVEITFANGKTQRLKYEGLVDIFTRRHLKRDVVALSEKTREVAQRFLSEVPCSACHGNRLNPAALATRIDGRNIADWSRMHVSDLIELFTHTSGQAPLSVWTRSGSLTGEYLRRYQSAWEYSRAQDYQNL